MDPEYGLARHEDDRVVEPADPGKVGVSVRTGAGGKQCDVSRDAGGAQQPDQERRLVLAVAVATLQRLGRRARDEFGLAELDSGVTHLSMQPVHEAPDRLLARLRARGEFRDQRGQVGPSERAVYDLGVTAGCRSPGGDRRPREPPGVEQVGWHVLFGRVEGRQAPEVEHDPPPSVFDGDRRLHAGITAQRPFQRQVDRGVDDDPLAADRVSAADRDPPTVPGRERAPDLLRDDLDLGDGAGSQGRQRSAEPPAVPQDDRLLLIDRELPDGCRVEPSLLTARGHDARAEFRPLLVPRRPHLLGRVPALAVGLDAERVGVPLERPAIGFVSDLEVLEQRRDRPVGSAWMAAEARTTSAAAADRAGFRSQGSSGPAASEAVPRTWTSDVAAVADITASRSIRLRMASPPGCPCPPRCGRRDRTPGRRVVSPGSRSARRRG